MYRATGALTSPPQSPPRRPNLAITSPSPRPHHPATPSIQRYFPTIKDPELQFTTGMVAAYYALIFLQGQYRGLQLRRMRQRGDVEALQVHTVLGRLSGCHECYVRGLRGARGPRGLA